MIDITDRYLYEAALRELENYSRNMGRSFKGRLTQLFLGLKFWQSEVPSIFSGQSITSSVIEDNLDDLYSKASRSQNNCVVVLFENRHLARTGIVGIGNQYPQNTWRNNFRLQKGVVCYASPEDLANHDFLNQTRINCTYLRPILQNQLAQASCDLCPSGAKYRGEEQPKWVRAETTEQGERYSIVDLANIQNFLPHIVPSGQRIPVLPLIVALYYDAPPGIYGSSTEIDLDDFTIDYGFSEEEFITYFDDDKQNQYNWQLLQEFPAIDYTSISQSWLNITGSVPATSRALFGRRTQRTPEPLLTEIEIPEPGSNTGWGAQQYVMAVLRSNGWTVYDVSQQRCGYDLVAEKSKKRKYIEVKSSLGFCSPTLTAREWQKADEYGSDYWLAVVENFQAEAQNPIYWIPNPVMNCTARESTVIQYSIARGSWLVAVVDDVDISSL